MNLLTTKQFGAACKPPITSARVWQLIEAGQINATLVGDRYVIEPAELKRFASVRNTKRGWPAGKKRF